MEIKIVENNGKEHGNYGSLNIRRMKKTMETSIV